MKKIILTGIFLCCVCLMPLTRVIAQDDIGNASAVSQIPKDTKPAATSPYTIALAFYKLSRQAPDFDSWVKQKDSYKNANHFDQPGMLTDMEQKMKDDYNALALTEPLVVETQVTLAPYDAKNQGFFVESFKSSTFFPSQYAGQSYAIVPQDITDKQWLKVDDTDTAKAIETAASSNNHVLSMVLMLVPKYADPSAAATIDDESYWPIVAEVKKMMLYPPDNSPDRDNMLWQSGTAANDKDYQRIINLRQ